MFIQAKTAIKHSLKPVLFLLAFQCSLSTIQAQTKEVPYPVNQVEIAPLFPGGKNELMNYLAQNIQYPAQAKAAKIEQMIVLSFIIDKDGSIQAVKAVEEGYNAELLAESIRVVQAMPKWKPGIKDGKIVQVSYKLPIKFKLS